MSLLFFLCGLMAVLSAQSPVDTTIVPAVDSLQVKDSLRKIDSTRAAIVSDSLAKMPSREDAWQWQPGVPVTLRTMEWEAMKRNPFFGVAKPPVVFHGDQRKLREGKESLFYLLILLLLIYALLKKAFPKYFSDLFRLFFRTTLKQRQIKEQLMQTPLPSMMLNGFFAISGGLYLCFLLTRFDLNVPGGFWIQLAYCCLALGAIYFVKFVGLKFSGWLFDMNEAADNYIFIVFVVNKMIAILLLPFLILLAFSSSPLYDVAVTTSLCVVGGLFCYRMILTFAAIRNQVKVNPFHFFLYLCAFEIAPLLLMYKGLLLFFGITT